MTALKEYARLEASGLWRPAPDAQRREVGVAFGEATIVISDPAGRALAHWSLPAVERLNPGQRPALYSPDGDVTEVLELDEDLMIGAIEKVRRSLARSRPRRGRLRQAIVWSSAVAILLVAVFWLPGALIRETQAVVPMAKRAEIGASLLGHLQRAHGQTCRNPLGTAALARLHQRLFGAGAPGQIVVLPEGPERVLVLPGRIVVLTREMVEGPDDPQALARRVLAAAERPGAADPLASLLRDAGIRTTLTLLTTGDLPAGLLEAYAADLSASGPAPAGADVAIPGEGPVLSDRDWLSLQGICRS